MEPVTHARLIQAALPSKDEDALDIGGATGYSAALLSRLCGRVVAVETDSTLMAAAESAWRSSGCTNIIPHQGNFAAGCTAHAPYSVMLINGSVAVIPQDLLNQLAPGGRLLAVVKEPGRVGRAVIVTKSASGATAERVLFEASVPYLPGHEPVPSFVF